MECALEVGGGCEESGQLKLRITASMPCFFSWDRAAERRIRFSPRSCFRFWTLQSFDANRWFFFAITSLHNPTSQILLHILDVCDESFQKVDGKLSLVAAEGQVSKDNFSFIRITKLSQNRMHTSHKGAL